MLLGTTPLNAVLNGVRNLGFHDYSGYDFTAVEYSVLGLGCAFAPTPRHCVSTLRPELNEHFRKLGLTEFYSEPDREPPPDWWDASVPIESCPVRFRVPGRFDPLKNPPDGWQPSEGLLKYVEAAATDLEKILNPKPAPHIRPNLSREQRAAITKLKANRDLTFGDCDKSTGSTVL